jgi:hypothetical protein
MRPNPSLGERAAVLLKIAAGQSIRSAAATGGLKPHHRDRVCPSSGPLPDRRSGWVAGPQGARAHARLLSPRPLSRPRPRSTRPWRTCPPCVGCGAHAGGLMGSVKRFASLRARALATVWRTLRRWKLAYKRGRRQVHSPDWEDEAKVQRSETITWYSRQAPGRIGRRSEEEVTSSRHPTLAQGSAPCGSALPYAEQGVGCNTARRIAACLDVETGRLLAWQRAHCDRETRLEVLAAGGGRLPQSGSGVAHARHLAGAVASRAAHRAARKQPDAGRVADLCALARVPWSRSGVRCTKQSSMCIPGPTPGNSCRPPSKPG